jgi:putative transcriptional regulator
MTTAIPEHHLPEDVILEYAMGTATEAVSLVAATHISLCPVCARQLLVEETRGGDALASGEDAAAQPGALEATMAMLAKAKAPISPALSEEGHDVEDGTLSWLPRPVREYVKQCGGLRWRTMVPGIGIQGIDLPVATPGVRASLYRSRPGLTIPLHDHRGDEYSQILLGGFRDGADRFSRGDFVLREPGHRHAIHIDRDGPCVSLIVAEAPPIPLTLLGRIAALAARRG